MTVGSAPLPEGSQKIEKTVDSSADSEPGPDDNYDTLTFGSIRVTEAIHVRIASSGSSEQHTGELSAASKGRSQPGITTFGERGATEATSLAEAGVAVQASEPRSPPPQSTFLQSTSNDIEEIKRILKDMQCKLEQMEFPRDGTSTPTHGQCCVPKRKGLSTRQLDLFAFAVSWIVCLQGIVAAVVTAVFWNRGSKYYPHLPDRLCELALTLIIIEALLATLAFCGCWSVRKKSPIMMTLVAAANSILILIQFGTLGWTFSHTPKASHLALVGITALSETQFSKQGQLDEVGSGYTYFYDDCRKAGRCDVGVAFTIRNDIVTNDHLTTLRPPLRSVTSATLISAHASLPPITSFDGMQNNLYEDLHALLATVQRTDKLVAPDNFTVRILKNHAVWGGVLGHRGLGNGSHDDIFHLRTSTEHRLLTNSFFRHPMRKKSIRMYP
ncbi:hypothetical protein SprV_0200709900 [Sparganum proliferum]